MKVEQIYTGCLAEATYYIESKGEAVIIDPLREVTPYIEKATADGAKIKYILETHFHADFVSGHVDLAKKTGATIVYGPNATTGFEAHFAHDGEQLKVGDLTIEVIHTPGHTMESTTYLLKDESGKDYCIFTGDTLFIGDVGRPDLAVKTDLSRADLAAHLFDSLRNKIMPLADDVIVYPAHGAGSACGKKMSKETWDTLGNQKQSNYALRADMTKEEFIQEVTSGLSEAPQYFPKNAVLNKIGYESIDKILETGVSPLDANLFEQTANQEAALILDVRTPNDFEAGHIPGSIYIGINGGFAPWVGALIIDIKQPILLITPEGREEETVTRLARVGYDNTLGYLEGGIAAWQAAGKAIDTVTSIDAQALEQANQTGDIHILDVRKESEFASKHIIGAVNFPLDFINKKMEDYNDSVKQYIHCAGGYRSMIAASILKARGYHDLINVRGGFKAIEQTKIPQSEFICPSTLV